MDGCADEAVDVARGPRRQVVNAAGDDRLADGLGRIVALMGHTDQFVGEADRADDLRGGGQQRNDSHHGADSA